MPRKVILVELYTNTSYELSRLLTLRYSTSFGTSTKLFSPSIQPRIFAIYGLVRIADEIVDTYQGADAAELLSALQSEVSTTIATGYSTNPIVHAFADTAKAFSIGPELIDPFFESMRTDLEKKAFTQTEYETYIYGSAEVIGLMCLKVFTQGDDAEYTRLEAGARSLGAAYQKVNFLRDIAGDFEERGRVYFPSTDFDSFDDSKKREIIEDIQHDFDHAELYLQKLPKSARTAVTMSYAYYSKLLATLKNIPAESLKRRRISLPKATKLAILVRYTVRSKGTR